MPGMDGWAVLTSIKGDEELSDIPIIMISMLDDRSLGYALGAADYLSKPVERARLISVLSRYVNGKARGNVLIIEDDEAAREMMRRILKNDGWTTKVAENGIVGLEQLPKAKPDAILLDLMMPEMNGFEFLDKLRKNTMWRDIPVIVVTAKALSAEDHRRLKGSVELLIKKEGDEIEIVLASLKKVLPAQPLPTAGNVRV